MVDDLSGTSLVPSGNNYLVPSSSKNSSSELSTVLIDTFTAFEEVILDYSEQNNEIALSKQTIQDLVNAFAPYMGGTSGGSSTPASSGKSGELSKYEQYLIKRDQKRDQERESRKQEEQVKASQSKAERAVDAFFHGFEKLGQNPIGFLEDGFVWLIKKTFSLAAGKMASSKSKTTSTSSTGSTASDSSNPTGEATTNSSDIEDAEFTVSEPSAEVVDSAAVDGVESSVVASGVVDGVAYSVVDEEPTIYNSPGSPLYTPDTGSGVVDNGQATPLLDMPESDTTAVSDPNVEKQQKRLNKDLTAFVENPESTGAGEFLDEQIEDSNETGSVVDTSKDSGLGGGLLALLIAGLVAALFMFMPESVINVLASFLQVAVNLFSAIAPLLVPFISAMLNLGTALINAVTTYVVPLIGVISNVLTTYIPPIAAAFTSALVGILDIITTVAEVLMENIPPIASAITGAVVTVLGAIGELVVAVKDTLIELLSNPGAFIGKVFTGFIDEIKKAGGILGILKDLIFGGKKTGSNDTREPVPTSNVSAKAANTGEALTFNVSSGGTVNYTNNVNNVNTQLNPLSNLYVPGVA